MENPEDLAFELLRLARIETLLEIKQNDSKEHDPEIDSKLKAIDVEMLSIIGEIAQILKGK